MAKDLTRWNRAGLGRVRYVDGNAATYLEQLREQLRERFPNWPAMALDAPPAGENERQWKARLEAEYQANRDDLLWQMTRSFARACHVLGEHLDAYANEATLGTATEWDNLRKLVEMLDYHPRPPASSYTPLVVLAKPAQAGLLEPGFQVKHSPAGGGAPVIFETLDDIELDWRLNELRPLGYNRNPDTLSGDTLLLEGVHDKLQSGEPVVLEHTETGKLSAHLIQGVSLDKVGQTTSVTVSPRLSHRFTLGATLIHARPRERLAPLGPREDARPAGRSLQLTGSTEGLASGDLVVLSGSGNKKPLFRRISQVHATRLVFTEPMAELSPAQPWVSRPVTVPLTHLANGPWARRIEGEGEGDFYVVYAAGDWSWLHQSWVARRPDSASEPLIHFKVHKAHYQPVGQPAESGSDDHQGYTAITLHWSEEMDRADVATARLGHNPQYLLAVPRSPGPWQADTYLRKEDSGKLTSGLITESSKHTGLGDLAVVVRGDQCAWARLTEVAQVEEPEEAPEIDKASRLTAEGSWQDRGGGPYYLTRTRVYSHFREQLRLVDWQQNDTPLSGQKLRVTTPDGGVDFALAEGRPLILGNGHQLWQSSVQKFETLDDKNQELALAEALPKGTTAGNLVLYGNVVLAGHGSHKPERVLGSGDATLVHQEFELDVPDVSFVADSSQASGVRAAAVVSVAGRIWQQIANLKDAAPTDSVYTVRVTQDGTLRFRFGDGRQGRRLPTGGNNVRISYRQGVGPQGNLPAGSLTKPVRPNPLVEAVMQPLAASGGAAAESTGALRKAAPATLLTLSRAVSLTDFALLARSHSSVWQARAFTRPNRRSRRELVEVVVVPAEGASLTDELRGGLEEYLTAHALPGVVVRVLAYEPVLLVFDVSLRVDLEAYDGEEVREAVRQRLIESFSLSERQLGQPIYRGEIFQVVEGVAGVANSTCELMLEPDGESHRIIRAEPNQCLHLSASDPQITLHVEPYEP